MTKTCWAKRGKMFIKAVSGRIVEIRLKDELQDLRLQDATSLLTHSVRRNNRAGTVERTCLAKDSSAADTREGLDSIYNDDSENTVSESDRVAENPLGHFRMKKKTDNNKKIRHSLCVRILPSV